jgi:hypothetical protein
MWFKEIEKSLNNMLCKEIPLPVSKFALLHDLKEVSCDKRCKIQLYATAAFAAYYFSKHFIKQCSFKVKI